MGTEFVPATLEHVMEMAKRLHPGNEAEAQAIAGIPGVRLLRLSYLTSQKTWAGVADGKVYAIFGLSVVPILAQVAMPWMMCSADITEVPISFVRGFRRQVEALKKAYPRMECRVYHQNQPVVELLSWCGFTINPAEPWGNSGELFYRCEWRDPKCA